MAEIDESELTQRHAAARNLVQGLITLSLIFVALAFAGVRPPLPQSLLDPNLYRALWIVILFFGFGAITIRRTRSNATRLQDTAALKGVAGLVASLQKTTALVASLGGAIALLGLLASMMSRDPWDMLKAAVVAVAVLLYAYPRREAWRRVVASSQQPDGIQGPSPAKGTSA